MEERRMETKLTKTEARNLADFIEVNIFEYIEDAEIDNIGWLEDMISIFKKCKKIAGDE